MYPDRKKHTAGDGTFLYYYIEIYEGKKNMLLEKKKN